MLLELQSILNKNLISLPLETIRKLKVTEIEKWVDYGLSNMFEFQLTTSSWITEKIFNLNLEVSSQESAGFPLFWRECNFKTCQIFGNLRKLHLCFVNFAFYPLTFLPNFMRICISITIAMICAVLCCMVTHVTWVKSCPYKI